MTRDLREIPVVGDRGNGCPLAPPQHASIQSRALHRACLILGGVQQLAAHLKVSELDLRRWLKGEEPPPDAMFHAAVEILLLSGQPRGPSN